MMDKKKKIVEAPPVEQVEKAPKELLVYLIQRAQEEDKALDDHMGTIIGDRDRPPI